MSTVFAIIAVFLLVVAALVNNGSSPYDPQLFGITYPALGIGLASVVFGQMARSMADRKREAQQREADRTASEVSAALRAEAKAREDKQAKNPGKRESDEPFDW